MARLPGLRPIDEERRRSGGGQNRGRVSTPSAGNIRPQGLSPSASPVDTYARPEQAPVGSNGWESLAKALSGIQPSINQFIQVQGQANQGGDADVNSVNAFLIDKSPEERAKAIKEGNVPGLKTLVGREAAAERITYDAMSSLEAEFATSYDPATGNIDQWLGERVKPLIDQYGGDPLFKNAFATKLSPFVDKLKGKAGELRTTAQNEALQGSIFEKWYSKDNFQLTQGAAPQEIVASTFADFDKNQRAGGIDFKTQQGMVLQRATQLAAEGKYDLATEYLKYQRQDGPYKGNLLSDAQYGQQATALQDRINTEQQKLAAQERSRLANEQLIMDAKEIALKGGLAGIQDAEVPTPDGQNTKTVSADTIRKDVGKAIIADIDKEAQSNSRSPEQAAELSTKMQKDVFTKNAIEHPTWFSLIKSGYATMTVDAATGPIPPAATDGYAKWKELYKDSPQYLEKFGDPKAKDFYETAEILEEDGIVSNPDDALRRAFLVTRSTSQLDETDRARYDQVDAQVEKVIDAHTGAWWNPYGDAAPVNGMDVRRGILSRAKIYARAGLPIDQALDKAGEYYQRSHINVAGTFILNDKRLPPTFKPDVEKYLTKFAEKHKLDVNDLTVMDAGNGVGGYFVAQRGIPFPIDTADGGRDFMFNLKSLEDMNAAEREAVVKDTVKQRK